MMNEVYTEKKGFCWIPTLSGNIFSTIRLDFLDFISDDQYLYPPNVDESIDPEFYQNRIWIIEFNPNHLEEIINLSLFEISDNSDESAEDNIPSIIDFEIKSISKSGFTVFEISLNEELFNDLIEINTDSGLYSDELGYCQESKEIIKEQIKSEVLKKMINHFYFLIRELYHTHTHHDKNHELHSENSHLLPIYLTTENDLVGKIRAIIYIADNFKEKIPIYHEYINTLRLAISQKKNQPVASIKNKKDLAFNNWLDIIRMGVGEMIYAQQFVLGHCSDKISQEYNYYYENATRSFNSIFNEINAQYQHDEQIIQRELQKQMKTYTVVVIYLTLTSSLFGLISCLNSGSILLNNYNWIFCLCSLFIIGITFVGYNDDT